MDSGERLRMASEIVRPQIAVLGLWALLLAGRWVFSPEIHGLCHSVLLVDGTLRHPLRGMPLIVAVST